MPVPLVHQLVLSLIQRRRDDNKNNIFAFEGGGGAGGFKGGIGITIATPAAEASRAWLQGRTVSSVFSRDYGEKELVPTNPTYSVQSLLT